MEKVNISFLAPAVFQQQWATTTVLGSISWLWINSKHHQQHTIQTFHKHLLPVINCQQFALFYLNQQPIAYITWAMFDEEAEQAYIQDNRSLLLHPQYWNSGSRMWLIDWFAPFGHSIYLKNIIQNQIFPTSVVRFLYHRSEQTKAKILHAKGVAVTAQEYQYWMQHNPLPAL